MNNIHFSLFIRPLILKYDQSVLHCFLKKGKSRLSVTFIDLILSWKGESDAHFDLQQVEQHHATRSLTVMLPFLNPTWMKMMMDEVTQL